MQPARSAVTLVELLVVAAIVGLLLALLLPAVQTARESARQTTCKNHLRQLALALQAHHAAHARFPSNGWGFRWMGDPDGGPADLQPGGWIYGLLPYLEQEPLARLGRGARGAEKEAQLTQVMHSPLAVLHCPSRRRAKLYPYVGKFPLFNVPRPDAAAKCDYAGNGGTEVIELIEGPPSLSPAAVAAYPWAGAAEANVKETLRACEHYHALGCRAVAIVSPFYYKLTPAGVYAYFKEIADQSPIDITLYNIPLFASPIDVPTVQRLAEECPRVVAIKDSSGDLPHMMRMIAAVRPLRPDFAFLTGWDAALMPLLLVGCDGGTNASSGVVPEITRKLYDLTLAGQLDAARALQYRLLPLFDTMLYSAEFPEGFRAGVALRGFHTGRGRQPQSLVQQQALAQLRDQIQCLLAAEGFVEEPVGGCPAGQPASAEQVARIVQNVVEELRRRGMA